MTNLYTIHPDTFPFTKDQSGSIFKHTEVADSDVCNWVPDICHEPAVRLGEFTVDDRNFTLKYLCERHKQMGMKSEPL